MRKIALRADDDLIERARYKAREEGRTLNAVFCEWLRQFAGPSRRGDEFLEFMRRTSYARPGRKFTREEMNER